MRIILVRTRGLFRPTPEVDYAAEALVEALKLLNHSVDLVTIPFRWGASKLASLRSFDLSRTPMDEAVDQLISLDLPASVLEHPRHQSLLLESSHRRESVLAPDLSRAVRGLLSRPGRPMVASSCSLLALRACAPTVDCPVVVPGLARGDLGTPWSSARETNVLQIEDPAGLEDLEGSEGPEGPVGSKSIAVPDGLWRTDLLLSACARSRSSLVFRWVVETEEAGRRVRERAETFRLESRVLVQVRKGRYRLPGAHPLGLVDLRPQRGLAFPALAAIRSGTPILTSALSGATCQVVEQANWGHVVPETAQQLVEAIERLEGQPAEVGVKGLARYRSIASDWAVIANQLVEGWVDHWNPDGRLGVA